MERNEQDDLLATEAQNGEKIIEIKVRFGTDGLAESGRIKPRHAWAHGYVDIKKSRSHGLQSKDSEKSDSLFELTGVIERALDKHEVKLHFNSTCGRVFAEP